jgi:hypothetical protein
VGTETNGLFTRRRLGPAAESAFAKPAERCLEPGIGHSFEPVGERLQVGRIELRRRAGSSRFQGSCVLQDRNGGDGAKSIKPVDALDDRGSFMLEVESAPGRCPNDQGATKFPVRFAGPARPFDSFRPRMKRQLLADDCRPLRHEVALGKAMAGEGCLGEIAEMLVECVHGSMTARPPWPEKGMK